MAIPASCIRRNQIPAGYRAEDNPNPRVLQRRSSLPRAEGADVRQRTATPKVAHVDETAEQDGSAMRAPAARNRVRTTEDDIQEPTTHPPVGARRTGSTMVPHASVPLRERRLFLLTSVGIGMGVMLYSILFVIVLAWIAMTTSFQFGLIHTTYTHTHVHGQAVTVISSNDNGSITVTVVAKQKDGTTQDRTYQGPVLSAEAWNNDLASIVATSRVANDGQTITVTLTGTINYFRLFFTRPSMTFSLVPDDKAGYKIVVP